MAKGWGTYPLTDPASLDLYDIFHICFLSLSGYLRHSSRWPLAPSEAVAQRVTAVVLDSLWRCRYSHSALVRRLTTHLTHRHVFTSINDASTDARGSVFPSPSSCWPSHWPRCSPTSRVSFTMFLFVALSSNREILTPVLRRTDDVEKFNLSDLLSGDKLRRLRITCGVREGGKLIFTFFQPFYPSSTRQSRSRPFILRLLGSGRSLGPITQPARKAVVIHG